MYTDLQRQVAKTMSGPRQAQLNLACDSVWENQPEDIRGAIVDLLCACTAGNDKLRQNITIRLAERHGNDFSRIISPTVNDYQTRFNLKSPPASPAQEEKKGPVKNGRVHSNGKEEDEPVEDEDAIDDEKPEKVTPEDRLFIEQIRAEERRAAEARELRLGQPFDEANRSCHGPYSLVRELADDVRRGRLQKAQAAQYGYYGLHPYK